MVKRCRVKIGDRIFYSCGCHSLIIAFPLIGMMEQAVLGKDCVVDRSSKDYSLDDKSFYSAAHLNKAVIRIEHS